MTREKTLGKIATDLQANAHKDADHSVQERIAQSNDSRIKILNDAYEAGKKKYSGDFYIEMCLKHEKLFWNVDPRWIPHVRQSCPTPMFEQTVYRYNRKDDILEYLWVMPDIRSASWLLENALLIPSEQKELLDFVIAFNEGKLLQLCKKLNNEYDTFH